MEKHASPLVLSDIADEIVATAQDRGESSVCYLIRACILMQGRQVLLYTYEVAYAYDRGESALATAPALRQDSLPRLIGCHWFMV